MTLGEISLPALGTRTCISIAPGFSVGRSTKSTSQNTQSLLNMAWLEMMSWNNLVNEHRLWWIWHDWKCCTYWNNLVNDTDFGKIWHDWKCCTVVYWNNLVNEHRLWWIWQDWKCCTEITLWMSTDFGEYGKTGNVTLKWPCEWARSHRAPACQRSCQQRWGRSPPPPPPCPPWCPPLWLAPQQGQNWGDHLCSSSPLLAPHLQINKGKREMGVEVRGGGWSKHKRYVMM